MGRIFKRTMGDTNKVAFCFHPINCNFKFFIVSVIPAKSSNLRDEAAKSTEENSLKSSPKQK